MWNKSPQNNSALVVFIVIDIETNKKVNYRSTKPSYVVVFYLHITFSFK